MAVHEFTIKEVELIIFKKRKYVRRLTSEAIRVGKLVRPICCELCLSEGRIEAHHIDYGRPMFVSWLCKRCHVKAHTPDHCMNPDNNNQTPMPYLINEYKHVTVTFDMPVRNYLALKEESEKTGKPIGTIMRKKAESLYPVYNPQMEFKLEDHNDKSQYVAHERVQGLEEDEGLCEQPKRPLLQEVRRSRNYNMQGMEQQLFAVPLRHGEHAGRVQRNFANR